MNHRITIGLIGDYDPTIPAHQAIPTVLQLSADALQIAVHFEWVPTEEVTNASRVSANDGIWCVPGSPYKNMEGALLAVRFARESGTPFLGTCGGFQHAVVEYARNVLGWSDADHAETATDANRLVISALECSLVEVTGRVRLFPNTVLPLPTAPVRPVKGTVAAMV